MKSPGFLVAERPLAQHSERLSARAKSPKELAGSLADVLPRLKRAIAEKLDELTGGGGETDLTIEKIETVAAAKAHKLIDQVGVHFLLGNRGAGEVLVSLDRASALMLTDQVFGGAGEAPEHLPDKLPAAASLTMVRLGAAIGQALADGFEQAEPLAVGRQHDVLGKLLPAGEEELLYLLRAQVTSGTSSTVRLNITIRESEADRLLENSDSPAAQRQQGDRRRPDGSPFGGLPMELAAVLAELAVPVSRLAQLQVGDVIPMPIRQEIPLRIGAVEIARGKPGCENGQIALRVTQTAWSERKLGNDG